MHVRGVAVLYSLSALAVGSEGLLHSIGDLIDDLFGGGYCAPRQQQQTDSFPKPIVPQERQSKTTGVVFVILSSLGWILHPTVVCTPRETHTCISTCPRETDGTSHCGLLAQVPSTTRFCAAVVPSPPSGLIRSGRSHSAAWLPALPASPLFLQGTHSTYVCMSTGQAGRYLAGRGDAPTRL